MLNTFLKINLPYGFTRGEDNKWFAFNREYMPLGFNDTSSKLKESMGFIIGEDTNNAYNQYPVYSKYTNISEKLLLSIAEGTQYDTQGKIVRIFLYNDATVPYKGKNLDNYFEKLKILSKLKHTGY